MDDFISIFFKGGFKNLDLDLHKGRRILTIYMNTSLILQIRKKGDLILNFRGLSVPYITGSEIIAITLCIV